MVSEAAMRALARLPSRELLRSHQSKVWVPAEPKSIAEEHHRFAAGLILGGMESTTQRGPNAENIEEVPGDSRGGKLFRVTAAGEVEDFIAECSHARERSIAAVHDRETRIGK